jgi:hypothetical protein
MKTILLACGIVGGLLPVTTFGITWPGDSVTLPGTSLAARPELAGDVIANQTFSFHGGIGDPRPLTLDNWVLRENATGTLDFYYRINAPSDAGGTMSPFYVTRFDLGPSLDVDYRTDLGGSDPGPWAMRGGFQGSVLFGPNDPAHGGPGIWNIGAQGSLKPFFIHTSATEFQSTGIMFDTFQGPAVTTIAFAPVLSVPEPEFLGIMCIGLAAVAARPRLRRKAELT